MPTTSVRGAPPRDVPFARSRRIRPGADAVLFLALLVSLASCVAEPRDVVLMERSVPPDTGGLPADFRERGGPVLLHLTGWAKPEVVSEIAALGVGPLPGYRAAERLDSLGLNIVGGVIPPGGLDRIAALRYVVRIEPAR